MQKSTLRQKKNALKQDLEKLRDILSTTAYDVGDQAKMALAESYESVKDKSVDIQGSVKKYVYDKPFKALGFAVLSGLFLGWTMRKK